ncbi:hypothetical protein SISSUDRAFT_1032985, partial [Sistotremastrum suecicum HHB10207 ss-3]
GEKPDPSQYYKDLFVNNVAPTPIIRLALHLFAICPNSASCERLFSTFGLILTKLRSRLGNERLLGLAELKMHLRDEHVRDGLRQDLQQRKRKFGVFNQPGAAELARSKAAAAVPVIPTPPTTTSVPPTHSTNPPTPLASSAVPTEDSDSDLELPSTLRFSPITVRSNDSLQSLATNLASLSVAQAPAAEPAPARPQTVQLMADKPWKFRIDQIFDFTNVKWIEFYKKSAVGRLNDEEEFYDLLNLDAEDEDVEEQDVDDTIEAILAS